VLDRIGGNLRQVVEALDIARLDSGRAPMALEEGDFPAALQGLLETPLLQCADFIARSAEDTAEEVRRRRIVARDLLEIERAMIPGEVDRFRDVHNRFARLPPSMCMVVPVT
jgi:hypothetical protein